MFDFLKNLLKTSNDAQIKKLRKTLDQINALEPDMKKLTDAQMRERIDALKRRAQGGEDLDALLPETYAWLAEYHLHEAVDVTLLTDAKTNIRYGVYYLRTLYDRYGSWLEACAAYNAGPGNVDAWLKDASLTRSDGRLDPEAIPFSQTYAYVAMVGATYETYAALYRFSSTPSFEERTK